eukprot:327292-Pyramimonas_sp.AAC.1
MGSWGSWGFLGNPAAIQVRVTSAYPCPRVGPSPLYPTDGRGSGEGPEEVQRLFVLVPTTASGVHLD